MELIGYLYLTKENTNFNSEFNTVLECVYRHTFLSSQNNHKLVVFACFTPGSISFVTEMYV